MQQRCLAMLVFITSLWVTEAVPYFATAILVPPMVVFLGILNDKAHPDVMLTSSTFVLADCLLVWLIGCLSELVREVDVCVN